MKPSKVSRYFLATLADGRTVDLLFPNRPTAEHAALQRFGADVTVRELSVVEWRKWRQGS